MGIDTMTVTIRCRFAKRRLKFLTWLAVGMGRLSPGVAVRLIRKIPGWCPLWFKWGKEPWQRIEWEVHGV